MLYETSSRVGGITALLDASLIPDQLALGPLKDDLTPLARNLGSASPDSTFDRDRVEEDISNPFASDTSIACSSPLGTGSAASSDSLNDWYTLSYLGQEAARRQRWKFSVETTLVELHNDIQTAISLKSRQSLGHAASFRACELTWLECKTEATSRVTLMDLAIKVHMSSCCSDSTGSFNVVCTATVRRYTQSRLDLVRG
ncbi:hypothetical protein NM208_g8247 [Fusarium decemcellulare]|uniref:Uncharacterized protein n=1 Tax=Fusarium decemcellulare TaxID=57161 RepID=A0ACC1S642_9HYPO|nr:hypothetical protein NM208_g8247 [Fusarium decemcellulare]